MSTWGNCARGGWGGGEGSSYDGLYGEAPLERLLRLQVYERVGISLVDKKGNLSLGYVKVPKRANRLILWLYTRKRSIFVINSYSKDSAVKKNAPR